MLKLRTDLRIRSRLVLKCDNHVRYNPDKDGAGAIRGNCPTCAALLTAYQARHHLLAAAKDYAIKAEPFETFKPRARRVRAAEGAPTRKVQ